MALYPNIKLSILREIGWGIWDPIGLANPDGTWDDACADEYDSYLLAVVSLLCRGGTKEEASAYLADIASNHMGLSTINRGTASSTATAIADYLKSLPVGPKAIR